MVETKNTADRCQLNTTWDPTPDPVSEEKKSYKGNYRSNWEKMK